MESSVRRSTCTSLATPTRGARSGLPRGRRSRRRSRRNRRSRRPRRLIKSHVDPRQERGASCARVARFAAPRAAKSKQREKNMRIRDGKVVSFVLCLLVAPVTWAQSQDSKWAFGARAGLAIPAGELNGFTGKAADTGILLNLDLMYKASSNWDIGGSVEYQNNKMPSISGPGTANGAFGQASITVLTLMAVGQYRFNRASKTSPYLVGGIGLNINWMGDDQAGNSFDVDPSLAIKLGVGADFYVSKSTALNVEAGYKVNSSSVTRFPPTGSSQSYDFNMSTLYLLGGVRF